MPADLSLDTALDCLFGKQVLPDVSIGDIRQWFWEASRNISICVSESFDCNQRCFHFEKAAVDIIVRYNTELPLIMFSYWIIENSSVFDEKTVEKARIVFGKGNYDNRYLEWVSFEMLHKTAIEGVFDLLYGCDTLSRQNNNNNILTA